MTTRQQLTLESFVRQLPTTAARTLASHLDVKNQWEDLAIQIPLHPDALFGLSNFEPRYSYDMVETFRSRPSSTKSLIDDWKSSNCKMKHLIQALKNAKLFFLSEYIQRDVLKLPVSDNSEIEVTSSLPDVPFSEEDNERVSISLGQQRLPDRISMEPPPQCSNRMKELTILHTSQPVANTDKEPPEGIGTIDVLEPTFSEENPVQQLDFDLLKRITNNFDEREAVAGGRLLGLGGFGKVFLGCFNSGQKVAVKVLQQEKQDIQKQFETERKTLSELRHENLVPLYGYCSTTAQHCLVFEYMSNGSLEERLACRNGTPPIKPCVRLNIAIGTGKGIVYLHSQKVTHRDIKSANILLDADLQPKVGDFATARIAPSGMTSKLVLATSVIGTPAYMAPEASQFHIHPGLDTYSFGVVLLELLTGQAANDTARGDIKQMVFNHCDENMAESSDESEDEEAVEKVPGSIFDLLDNKGGTWEEVLAQGLFDISKLCLKYHIKKPTKRIKMNIVVSSLEKLKHIS